MRWCSTLAEPRFANANWVRTVSVHRNAEGFASKNVLHKRREHHFTANV
nr:MAG TPA: hypothetical protein [Caudoviricetes sp.]